MHAFSANQRRPSFVLPHYTVQIEKISVPPPHGANFAVYHFCTVNKIDSLNKSMPNKSFVESKKIWAFAPYSGGGGDRKFSDLHRIVGGGTKLGLRWLAENACTVWQGGVYSYATTTSNIASEERREKLHSLCTEFALVLLMQPWPKFELCMSLWLHQNWNGESGSVLYCKRRCLNIFENSSVHTLKKSFAYFTGLPS